MTDLPEHPHLLPWYVAGKLSQGESREIERHLLACEECRDQAAALQSVQRGLRLGDAAAHPTEEDLVAHARGARGIESHVAACEACRQDLEALRASDARLQVRRITRRGVRWASAAAAVVVAAVGVVFLVGPRAPRAMPVTLPSAQRGLESPPVLPGAGPWRVTMVLPFGAPDGDYVARLDRGEGTPEIPLASPRSGSSRGVVELQLGSLPAGEYRLTMTPVTPAPDGAAGSRPLEYPFRLERSP